MDEWHGLPPTALRSIKASTLYEAESTVRALVAALEGARVDATKSRHRAAGGTTTSTRANRRYSNEVLDRELPSDPLAEAATLGLMLAKPALYGVAALRAEHFYDQDNRTVFVAVTALIDAALPVDVAHLTAHLQGNQRITAATIAAYYEAAASTNPTRIIEYVSRLDECLWRRRFFYRAIETIKGVHDTGKSLGDLSSLFRGL
jgi:hypothetical protein